MKKIFLFLLTLLMTATLVTAISMPHPIYGFITDNDNAISGLKVKVTNTDTKASAVTKTGDNGFYQVDLGNIDEIYRDGDKIKISLVYCETQSKCTKTIAISGGGDKISFDIAKESITAPLPKEVKVYKYVCWDGSKIDDSSKCPVQVEKVIEKEVIKEKPVEKIVTKPVEKVVEKVVIKKSVECADGSVESDIADCPKKEASSSWIYAVIAALIIIFGGSAGGGWKFYKGKFKHYHRGIRGYHDPNDKHRNEKYRHTAWKDSALKCIKEVTKIQKGYDLRDLK